MNFTGLVVVSLFIGLVLAQESKNAPEKHSCYPDMCDLLSEVASLRKTLTAVETRLQESETRLQDSETRLQESENQILELKNIARTKVIFSASVGVVDGPFGSFRTDTILIYRTVRTNIGNAYSPSTGVFTAPVSGVYYFTIFYHAGADRASWLTLNKNGEHMVATSDHSSAADGADNGGNAVFLQLQKGDRVYVVMAANTHVWGNRYHTTFSGFLVTQMCKSVHCSSIDF